MAEFASLFAARADRIDATNLVCPGDSAGAGGAAGELETCVDFGSDETAAEGELLLGGPLIADPMSPITISPPTMDRTVVHAGWRRGQLLLRGG